MARIISTITLIVAFQTAAAQVDFSTCNIEKGCFTVPDKCRSDCDTAVTYQLDSNDQYVTFELMTKLSGIDQSKFVAVGFSEDQQMGSDAVSACIYTPASPNPNPVIGYNVQGKDNEILSPAQPVTVVEAGGVNDSYMWCRFRQIIQPTDNMNGRIYSLNNSYYLLLAEGIPSSANSLAYHHNTRYLTSSKVAVVAVQSTSGGGFLKRLEKAHGMMMIFGWWLFISTAILFARYFRRMWPHTEWFEIKPWFHFHRGLNIVGVILIIAAFICIFVEKRGRWVGETGSIRIHSICGITCTICALLQPIMALFRCHPGAPKRFIFDWTHRIVGLLGWILGSVTIWQATDFVQPLHNNKSRALMILFWVFLGACVVALEVHLTATERIKSYRKPHNEVSLQATNGPGSARPKKTRQRYSRTWPAVRVPILVLFFCLALGVTISLACFIGLDKAQ